MCLLLGAIALLSRSSSYRIYYQDGQFLVNVRHGQWHDIRDFVQPDDPDVLAIFSQYGPDPWTLYDFVCKSIEYVADFGEYWRFPSETLRARAGDCEDSTFVFVSLAQNFDPDVWTILGSYQGYGHSWAAKNGFIYETTYTRAMPVPDPEDYCPYVLFSDQEVIELWPGALGEVFQLGRNEGVKLNLIAEALCFQELSKR